MHQILVFAVGGEESGDGVEVGPLSGVLVPADLHQSDEVLVNVGVEVDGWPIARRVRSRSANLIQDLYDKQTNTAQVDSTPAAGCLRQTGKYSAGGQHTCCRISATDIYTITGSTKFSSTGKFSKK